MGQSPVSIEALGFQTVLPLAPPIIIIITLIILYFYSTSSLLGSYAHPSSFRVISKNSAAVYESLCRATAVKGLIILHARAFPNNFEIGNRQEKEKKNRITLQAEIRDVEKKKNSFNSLILKTAGIRQERTNQVREGSCHGTL